MPNDPLVQWYNILERAQCEQRHCIRYPCGKRDTMYVIMYGGAAAAVLYYNNTVYTVT